MHAMASADLRKELDCSICLSMYTDPVTLRCGHNFCRVCIDRVLNTQERAGVYICPDCRAECQERPVLQRNITLCNIVGSFRSTRPYQEKTGIFCTYCIHSPPVPAAKSCLHCKASLCENHLSVHSKSAEHVLCDPTTALANRKCSVHKKLLEYYCTEDADYICASCCLFGKHSGHQMVPLVKVSEKKKEKLREVLQKLTTKRAETEKSIHSLHQRMREDWGKAAGVTRRVTALFRDITRQLEDLEKKVLSETSRQELLFSLSASDLIQELEIKKDELSGKIIHIEELCNLSDPVTVLHPPDIGDLCDTDDTKTLDKRVRGAGDLDVGLVSGTLHTLFDIITGINIGVYVQEASDLLMDVTTAGNAESNIITGINTGFYIQEDADIYMDGATTDCTESDMKTGINTGFYKQEYTEVYLDGVATDHTEFDTKKGIHTGFYEQEPTDLLLDVNTAGNNIQISGDRKTAFSSPNQKPPETERFQCRQVISTRAFSSGRHYWEVDVSKSVRWRVGVCYPSIDRRGRWSQIRKNDKSWGLCRRGYNQFSVRHGGREIPIVDNISCDRVRVYLDYEAGQLSFYSLCGWIRHLHTYTAAFTEPLHALLWVGDNRITLCGGVFSWEKLP